MTAFASGSHVGRYEIAYEVGGGGSATVYCALDPRFDRQVAVKVLSRQLSSDPTFRTRFQREGHIIASLEHASIVPVYDLGEAEGRLFLVMRHMAGGSLTERLSDGPLPAEVLLNVMERIGQALDYAHTREVIHRDVKPGNILFDDTGHAYLGDFGIAHWQRGAGERTEAQLTAHGQVLGTPAYMSPEQVQGKRQLDGRSDLYSLGIVLYQMLSGETPYQGDTTIQLALKHVLEPVPQIRDVRPDLSVAVEIVIARALAKRPEDRFASGEQLTTTLEAALEGRMAAGTVVAASPASGARTVMEAAPEVPATAGGSVGSGGATGAPGAARPSWWRRQPAWHWAAFGVAVLLLSGALIGYLLQSSAQAEPEWTPTPDAAALAAGTALPILSSTPTSTASAPLVASATTSASPSSTPTPMPSSTATPSLTPSPRPEAYSMVYDSDQPEGGNDIFIASGDGSNPRRLTNRPGLDIEADLSPDGRWVAYESQRGARREIRVVRADGSDDRFVAEGRLPDWSPDGRLLAYETGVNPVQIWLTDVATNDRRPLADVRHNVRSPSWAPDGERLVVMVEVDGVWQLAIIEMLGGAMSQITFDGEDKRFPAWSPDGELIAYNTLDADGNPANIWVITPEGEDARPLTTSGSNGRPAWSKDGWHLLYNGLVNGRWLIMRMERDGSNPEPVTRVGHDQRPDWGAGGP